METKQTISRLDFDSKAKLIFDTLKLFSLESLHSTQTYYSSCRVEVPHGNQRLIYTGRSFVVTDPDLARSAGLHARSFGSMQLLPALVNIKFSLENIYQVGKTSALRWTRAPVPIKQGTPDVIFTMPIRNGMLRILKDDSIFAALIAANTKNDGMRERLDKQFLREDAPPWRAYVHPDVNPFHVYFHFEETDEWMLLSEVGVSENTGLFLVSDGDKAVAIDTYSVSTSSYSYENIIRTRDSSEILVLQNIAKQCGLRSDEINIHTIEGIETLAKIVKEEFRNAQEDPFVTDEQLANSEEPITFLNGSEEELASELNIVFQALIPLSFYNKQTIKNCYVSVICGDNSGNRARVDDEDYGYSEDMISHVRQEAPESISEKFTDLVNAVISKYEPTGFSWEYNDGPRDRQSGYDERPHTLRIDLSLPPSAHEQMHARMELKNMYSVLSKTNVEFLLSHWNG